MTQEQLDRLKEETGSEYELMLLKLAPALISAAEEGLKTSQMIFEIHHATGCDDVRNEVDKVRSVVSERDQLQARVRELEESLGATLPMAKGYAHEHPVGNNQKMVQLAQEVLLSTSQPQEPRFTVEMVTRIFTTAYQKGHEDTVEGYFSPVDRSEYETLFREDVETLIAELNPQPNPHP